jgi:hypothetical protein
MKSDGEVLIDIMNKYVLLMGLAWDGLSIEIKKRFENAALEFYNHISDEDKKLERRMQKLQIAELESAIEHRNRQRAMQEVWDSNEEKRKRHALAGSAMNGLLTGAQTNMLGHGHELCAEAYRLADIMLRMEKSI